MFDRSFRALRPALTATLPLLVVTTAWLSVGFSAVDRPVNAHSFWPTLYSAKVALSVDGDRLGVVVTVEVPAVSMVGKFRKFFAGVDLTAEIEQGRFEALEEQFRQHQLKELATGLELRLGGERLGSWHPVDTPVNGRANEGFFVYLLELRNDRPPKLGPRVEVAISNQVHEGENILFANYVGAGPGWEVVEASTPQPPPDADLSVGSPAEIEMWSEDPERRVFRVVLRRVEERASDL